ncbi:MAG: GTP cyclohydrolase I FolE [Firmicutes bacterium]|nr:GTP cyclohydrolase I FolE [Bacillota bacterium]
MSIDKKRIEKAVKEILIAIGENPEREGLKETPLRVAEMYSEIFKGLHLRAEDEIKIFEEEYYDGMVAVKDIPLYSVCEHHLLPFFGKAHVVYIPEDKKILGISKIARLAEIASRKPQLQERLTNEIADLIVSLADAKGALVLIEAEHLCMTMRGVKKPGSKTVTIATRGLVKDNETVKNEALMLIGNL